MNKLTELNYRLKLRKQFTKAPKELLEITKNELNREIQRRNRKEHWRNDRAINNVLLKTYRHIKDN